MQDSKPSQDQIAAYRLKIKKLKYKIELQQKVTAQLRAQKAKVDIFRKNIMADAMNLQSILKKVNFYLSLKGLTLKDIFLACDSLGDEVIQVQDYIQLLKNIGVGLQKSEEEFLRTNLSGNFSSTITNMRYQEILDNL